MVRTVWEELSRTLPELKTSHQLGKPVPESFSIKLQRKLASTVPPRPMVNVSFEDAFEHLERLCQDGVTASEVMNYHDSHSLMVRLSRTQQS
jgi:hypothetical protein